MYLLSCAAATCLIARFIGDRCLIHLSLGLLFAYITLDDMFSIHEVLGEAISVHALGAMGLGKLAEPVGELIAFGGVGLLFIVVLWWTVRNSSARAICQGMVIMFFLSIGAFAGIFIDFLHSALGGVGPLINGLMTLLEDGTETVMLSLAALAAISMKSLPSQSVAGVDAEKAFAALSPCLEME